MNGTPKRRQRRLRAIWGAVAGVALIAGAGAPSALAAEVARPIGPNPHNRGYESLTPADLNGYGAAGAISSTALDRVTVAFAGGQPESRGGFAARYLAQRTGSRWTLSPLGPIPQSMGNGAIVSLSALSPDHSIQVYSVVSGLFTSPTITSYVRVDPSGQTQLLPPGDSTESMGVGSRDLSRFYVATGAAADPRDDNGVKDLYDIGTGEPQLVSRVSGPGGTDDPVAPCGTTFVSNTYDALLQHWVSDDGRRVFFRTRDESDCLFGSFRLYLRDRGDLTTEADDRSIWISGPQEDGELLEASTFLRARPDGSQAVFFTTTRLPVDFGPRDVNSTADIYRFTLGVGRECLTCVVPDAEVYTTGDEGAALEVTAVSEDLSRVYFVSERALAAGGNDGERNIYLLKDGELTYVAPASTSDNKMIGFHPRGGAQISPDGTKLLFRSNAPGLNRMTGTDNGGFHQYYLYDAAPDAGVVCVSCPAGGARADVESDMLVATPGGFPFPGDQRLMSDDGKIVVFRTTEALVKQDVNNDVDVYEWAEGAHTLLTDGQSSHLPQFQEGVADVSRDGTNVLIKTFSPLAPGVDVEVGAVINARRNGGFPAPPPPVKPCAGDACQGRFAEAPELLQPRSAGERPAESEQPDPSFKINRFTKAQRRAFARTGRAGVTVSANTGGVISAVVRTRLGRRTRTVAKASQTLTEAGRVRLRLSLSNAARRALRAGHRLRLQIEISYSETAAPRTMRMTLRASRRTQTQRAGRGR